MKKEKIVDGARCVTAGVAQLLTSLIDAINGVMDPAHNRVASSPGLQQVPVGGGIYGLGLDAETEAAYAKQLEPPARDTEVLNAVAIEESSTVDDLVRSATQSDIDFCVLTQQAAGDRKTVRSHLAFLCRDRRRTLSPGNATFPCVRWEFICSIAGLLLCAAVVAVLGAIGYLVYADWQVAKASMLASPLYDVPHPTDPNMPMMNPADVFVAAFCVVPIGMLTAAIKAFVHPPKFGVSPSKFKAIAFAFFSLAIATTGGFAWIVGGHESLLAKAGILGGSKQPVRSAIAGVELGASTPPFEYVAIVMVCLSTGSAVLACYLPVMLRPFIDQRAAIDNPRNRRKLSRINQAIAITRRSLSRIEAVHQHAEGVTGQLLLSSIDASRVVRESQAEVYRKRWKKFAGAMLLCVLPIFQGCGAAVVAVNEPAPAAPVAVQVPDEATVEAAVFMSAATPSDQVRPYLDDWLVRQLPGGSRVTVYDGERHRHVVSIDVPYGPPSSRVRNARFQESYTRLEQRLGSRKVGTSDQVNWPHVVDTINTRSPKTRDQTWLLLCGNPPYISAEYPAFSFSNNIYAADGLVGQKKTPFETEIKLPKGTLVSWLASSSQWGDSRAHRQGITQLQSVYWHRVAGRLIEITPEAEIAFRFKPPFSLAANPTVKNSAPVMVDATQPWDRLPPSKEAKAKQIGTVRDHISLRTPGSLGYRIEMAGGDVEELAGDSLVIQAFIDKSGSMQSKIPATVKTIARLARDLPALVTSFEIGVIVANQSSKDVFEIQTIRSRQADGGRSLRSLERFLDAIQTGSGDHPTFDAIEESVRILHSSGVGKRKFFLFLSDVVHFDGTMEDAKAEQKRLLQGMRKWTHDASGDHRVIALFSGLPSTPHESAFSTADQARFVREMTRVHPNGRLSTDPDVLVEEVVEAATLNAVPSLFSTGVKD